MKIPVGVRVEVGNNVLTCENHKTVEENLECVTRALFVLWGFDFDPNWDIMEQNGAKVTLYHSRG
jgi:hypothetical protein